MTRPARRTPRRRPLEPPLRRARLHVVAAVMVVASLGLVVRLAVVQVADGVVAEESKQRTRSRCLEYLAAKLRAAAPFDRLAVCDGAAPDLDTFLQLLEGIETRHGLITVDLGPVVGTHAGPGTIGACYILPG